MITAEPGAGPTVLRILLGSQLRRLREDRNVTREDAGYAIRASESKISRMELGRVGFKERDVSDLLTLYGVTDGAERDALLSLAREANQPGWWHKFSDILPNWFQAYVGLEAAASLIRTYEVQFIPGLLQTEEYARAVVLLANGNAPKEEVDRRVQLRMERQNLLTRANAPRFWAIIDEAVLRRPIGGRDIMRDQLEHLAKLAERPNITLQVIPFGYGGHAAAGGAFSLLRFPDQTLPDIVYIEQLTSALYLEKREDVDTYLESMERLAVEADSPVRSRERFLEIRQDFTPPPAR
ncbi:helix-turn-helix domain-containing protein [Cryptosporangium aurantiacum]|uniref:Helix-turn-helix domain-containing protein n=1 Tax=Cryptosporangium aurantiacum TaxID=134849 RepID=A0A1M7MMB4_9ACTN|nr:helix-turn-helix transcriptional regulator [Cryptosporangium aurantiacum]SHM92012.1 Helix-turn-helix domain-containing protein [Cryptosporangium aurantiacum]